ncbi:MAG: hypothetical protein ACRC1U_01000, partial [Vibrionaceae bacterium]
GAGGGGTPNIPHIDQANGDPHRIRPADMPMTRFLIQIGSENRIRPEDAGVELPPVEPQQQVQTALDLGDITLVGTTAGNYLIYQFVGAEGDDILKFTLDPNAEDEVDISSPPRYIHSPGQVHGSMVAALWGGYCYDYPAQGATQQEYEDLCQGIRVRYAGDNQAQPQ